MELKKVVLGILILAVSLSIPVFSQNQIDEDNPVVNTQSAYTPELWCWHLKAGTPYFMDQQQWGKKVEVDLDILVVDKGKNFHSLKITSKVYGDQGAVMITKDHGWVDSNPHYKVLLEDIELIAYPPYFIEITASNPVLGISRTITKAVVIK